MFSSVIATGPGWKSVGPSGGGEFSQLFVSGGYLFASEQRGVWRSADGGVTWTCIQPGIIPVGFMEVGSKLYETGTTLQSSDHGSTWKSSVNGSGPDSVVWQGICSLAFSGDIRHRVPCPGQGPGPVGPVRFFGTPSRCPGGPGPGSGAYRSRTGRSRLAFRGLPLAAAGRRPGENRKNRPDSVNLRQQNLAGFPGKSGIVGNLSHS